METAGLASCSTASCQRWASRLRELAMGKGFMFGDRGEVALRGFEDRVRLYEIRWREDTTEPP